MKNLMKIQSISLIALFLAALVSNPKANAQNLRPLDQEDAVYRSEHLRQVAKEASETQARLSDDYYEFAAIIGIGKSTVFASETLSCEFSDTHSSLYVDPTVSYKIESALLEESKVTLNLKPISGITRNVIVMNCSRLDGGNIAELNIKQELENAFTQNEKHYLKVVDQPTPANERIIIHLPVSEPSPYGLKDYR